MRNVAIIPARGGSKRIPRKNIKPFCGKPMIAWSIEAAKASNLFEHIIISTDDSEIAKIAESAGGSVPFIRPPELSNDYVGTAVVIKHATEWVIKNLGTIDNVCTIYATAPFISSDDLCHGYKLFCDSGSQIAFTVTSYPFPIQRAIKINGEGKVQMFYPEHYLTRSQDLVPAYHDAGQFYWLKTIAALNELSAFSSDAQAIILPRHRVQDIDTIEDWQRAELMFRVIKKNDQNNLTF